MFNGRLRRAASVRHGVHRGVRVLPQHDVWRYRDRGHHDHGHHRRQARRPGSARVLDRQAQRSDSGRGWPLLRLIFLTGGSLAVCIASESRTPMLATVIVLASLGALWIGMPDDPSQTVLYVFNKPIECIDISTSGWDARLPMGTQFFEIIAGDTVPATYAVASMPGKLQATVTFSYAGGMMPTEKVGSSGKVVIDAFTMSAHAVGTFDVTVTGGALKGSFDATSCASGREP